MLKIGTLFSLQIIPNNKIHYKFIDLWMVSAIKTCNYPLFYLPPIPYKTDPWGRRFDGERHLITTVDLHNAEMANQILNYELMNNFFNKTMTP